MMSERDNRSFTHPKIFLTNLSSINVVNYIATCTCLTTAYAGAWGLSQLCNCILVAFGIHNSTPYTLNSFLYSIFICSNICRDRRHSRLLKWGWLSGAQLPPSFRPSQARPRGMLTHASLSDTGGIKVIWGEIGCPGTQLPLSFRPR